MSKSDYRRRQLRRFKRTLSRHLPTFIALACIVLVSGGLIFSIYRFVLRRTAPAGTAISAATPAQAQGSGAGGSAQADGGGSAQAGGGMPADGGTLEQADAGAPGNADGGISGEAPGTSSLPQDETDRLIAQADRLALGYDYDGAIALLNDSGLDASDSRIAAALAGYEEAKGALVPADVKQTTHVFFHSLIMDTALAFDGDGDADGYNSVMTTKDEFLKILEELYRRDYVLVRLADVAAPAPGADGSLAFAWGEVLLPPGKKPLVMSQDDVCYYPYMEGDGFANRIVIGADGKPTCEMTLPDGSVSTGSYDLIPLLEDFIGEHPDFSYRGARAVIAFTGYEGILGYRTSSSYSDSPTYEEDRTQAAAVAQCLRENGWELASHSWGHLQLGVSPDSETGYAISDERFIADTDRWEAEVESLIGPTNILIYPYGNDISDWHAYGPENARFAYLQSKGFQYFCNVDASTPSWMQMGTTYLRMARRNLDGYRLYQDLIQTDPAKKRLTDLLDAAEVFDSARPTPVGWSY